MELKSKYTRFRAYQLKQPGSLYSYYDGSSFTLIESFISKDCIDSLNEELKICGVSEKGYIDCLHITSWDQDHCEKNSLEEILSTLKPRRIECPGYNPDSSKQNQVDCFNIIKKYLEDNKEKNPKPNVVPITKEYVSKLGTFTKWDYNNIIYNNPKNNSQPNDNSSLKLFRTGSFNVLSLGDIDSKSNMEFLKGLWTIENEVDILLLAHHGADNEVNVKEFFEAVNPTIILCSSNYDNQFSHPRDNVRQRINNLNIPLKTTKNGDVIIESTGDDKSQFSVINLQANSEEKAESTKNYKAKMAREYDKRTSTNNDALIKA
jgi:competence protein ComEC